MNHDYSVIAAHVERAAAGDRASFDAIVREFSPLAWSIVWTFGLTKSQGEDAVQGMWLRLVQNMHAIREPARIAGWIATTTRRECLAVSRLANKGGSDFLEVLDRVQENESPDPVRSLVDTERADAVRRAFRRLDEKCQHLLQMLLTDPPISYGQISQDLDLPVGSIGPTRARCLERLRRDPLIVGIV